MDKYPVSRRLTNACVQLIKHANRTEISFRVIEYWMRVIDELTTLSYYNQTLPRTLENLFDEADKVLGKHGFVGTFDGYRMGHTKRE